MRAFTIIACEQRTPEWMAARAGRVTGTSADAMLAEGRTKGSEGVQRRNLKIRLALERRAGRSLERDFQTQAMADGVLREADAFARYEAKTGSFLERTGFLAHTELMAGCSLDGHYGDFEGLVSIKCPEWAQHWETLRGGKIDLKYMRQIIHEQFITGALWTDFVSFNPDFDEPLQLVVVRVPRNESAITLHEAALRTFLAEVEVEYLTLTTMAEGVTAVSA